MFALLLCLVEAFPILREQHPLSVAVSSDAKITPEVHLGSHPENHQEVLPSTAHHALVQEATHLSQSMEVSSFIGNIIDKAKGGAGDASKLITKDFMMKLYQAYSTGTVEVIDKDFPFACLCHTKGFCMSRPASSPDDESGKDVEKMPCKANAGRAPDPGMRDDQGTLIKVPLMTFLLAPFVALLLMSCVKCCSPEKPDLLPNKASE
eukprot:GEMP01070177.1.p1 GENE.GEMP01070177.1~~GEMP01070177.1.p1  ORF type:complete len:207 (+),score=26.20 GEMP01070177.1:401-1021(+)